jgi:Family of unknown function (DUF6364)
MVWGIRYGAAWLPYSFARLAVRMEEPMEETFKLTIRLPKDDVEYAKQYAREHRITVTELIDRYLKSLQTRSGKIHPEIARISGLVPSEVDAREEYRAHILEKHR